MWRGSKEAGVGKEAKAMSRDENEVGAGGYVQSSWGNGSEKALLYGLFSSRRVRYKRRTREHRSVLSGGEGMER